MFIKLCMGPLTNDKSKKWFLILAGVAVFLVMGLRGDNYQNVYDLRVYKDFYESIGRTEWGQIYEVTEFEYGYTLLNKILYTLFPFSQFIILFSAFFCVFSVCRFIYLNSENVFFSFLFYVTLGSMGFMLTGLRQAIAICICLYGVEFAKKEKIFKFLFTVILAITMHRTAFFFFPFYFIVNNKYIKKRRGFIIVIVVALIIFAPALLAFGKSITQGELQAAEEALFTMNGIVPILLYVIGLIAQYCLYYKDEKNDNTAIISIMLSLGLGLYFLRFYNMALERFSYYYTQSSYICLTNIFGFIKKGESRTIAKILAVVLALILFARRLQTADYANYVFFWNI